MTKAAMTVAQTILDQLGGNKFIAMTGSKNLLGSENSLSMKLAKNQSGATHLQIKLDNNDTYMMEFFKITKSAGMTICLLTGIYCDKLQSAFTDVTGLDTRL